MLRDTNCISIRYGLVVRIADSYPAGPASIPGKGIHFAYKGKQKKKCKTFN